MSVFDFQLGGLIAAPYTPFDSNGDLKLGAIEAYADSLVRSGVKGVFICGTTGEGPSLTTDERMQVAQRWIDVARGKLKVVVHVGHCGQRDAIALAKHAKQTGAQAIGMLPPFFFKPANPQEAVWFCAPVAAAGELPFYYYHIPSMSGVAIGMVPLMELASQQIPNFRGIKFTHGDMMEFQRCRAFAGGKYEIAWGFDEMLLGAVAVGATAAVGSTYNYAAPFYLKMIDAFRANRLDEARKLSQQTIEIIAQTLFRFGTLRTGKAIMSLIGVDCGPTRPPIRPLDPEELVQVRKTCSELGVI